CDELKRAYPDWLPDRIYNTARLIVSALIAKIHTVEWTPAILATDIIRVGLRANWYGAPKDWFTQLGMWLLDSHALKGIPQTLPNHHAAPYSLTDEFAAVYRLHPLIPDDYIFYDYDTKARREPRSFLEIQGERTDDEMRWLRLHNVIYSFGIAHPGAITLHNYPKTLQRFVRTGTGAANPEVIDLSVVDIVRDRRRGVPVRRPIRPCKSRMFGTFPRSLSECRFVWAAWWGRESTTIQFLQCLACQMCTRCLFERKSVFGPVSNRFSDDAAVAAATAWLAMRHHTTMRSQVQWLKMQPR